MKTSLIALIASAAGAATVFSQVPPYDDGRTQPAPAVSPELGVQQESHAAPQQPATQGRLLSYKNATGAKVKNTYGQDLGKVENLVIDIHQGRVALAILSVGEVLGVGGKKVPVPFTALSLSGLENDLMLDAPQGKLQTAPGVESDAISAATYRDWAAWSYSYFGETPYWKEEEKAAPEGEGSSRAATPAASPAASPAATPETSPAASPAREL